MWYDREVDKTKARKSYLIALSIVVIFTIITCIPNLLGMITKTGIKPKLVDGTYYGEVVSFKNNKFSILVDVREEGFVEFTINGSTADDIMNTIKLVKDKMKVKIKIGDSGELTEWLLIKDYPLVNAK